MKASKEKGRPINGVLILDKPINLTSNAALQIVKRLYMARKAGHTGSLDPLASGMLPLCFGEATKFAQFLLDSDKRYLVTAKLGIKTATGDAEGEVLASRPVPTLNAKQIEEVLAKFRGKIDQVPSMYSAVKHQGEPLYKLAREGITVERASRNVEIFILNLLKADNDTLDLEVHCSKGTYVRTLVEDIGEVLGCGAHVIALRRLTVAHYQEQQMVSLETLEKLAALPTPENFAALDALLIPIDSMFPHWPHIQVVEAIAYYLRQGQAVVVPRAPTQGWLVLQLKDGTFLGVGEVLSDGKVAPKRLVR
jgi:tRNA pseudouridine55 synthase